MAVSANELKNLFTRLFTPKPERRKNSLSFFGGASLESVVSRCRVKDPMDIFTLATFAFAGHAHYGTIILPQDTASAYYLAQLSLLLLDKSKPEYETEKESIEALIGNNLKGFVKADCNSDFPQLFDGFDAYDLYSGVKSASENTPSTIIKRKMGVLSKGGNSHREEKNEKSELKFNEGKENSAVAIQRNSLELEWQMNVFSGNSSHHAKREVKGPTQDPRSLEEIARTLVNVINEKLLELESDGTKAVLRISLEDLRDEVQNYKQDLMAYILRKHELWEINEKTNLNVSMWFVREVLTLAAQYDDKAAKINASASRFRWSGMAVTAEEGSVEQQIDISVIPGSRARF
jgi:hypothetical protein